jgi:hypothetical protein
MKTKASNEPPGSSDLEGWRAAIAGHRLASFRLEAIAAAFQDLGDADQGVRRALAKHLNDAVLGMLRNFIGTNHPNEGWDMIYRAHIEIFAALLQPASADGRALRTAFGPRVKFRAFDAMAIELKHSRIPLQPRVKDEDETPTAVGEDEKEDDRPVDEDKANQVHLLVQPTEPGKDTTDFSGTIADEAVSRRHADPVLLAGVRERDENIDLKRVLMRIEPYQKRLAFMLHMDDLPVLSKRTASIAAACGVSRKTAEDWVEEVQRLLANIQEVQELKKVGEKS